MSEADRSEKTGFVTALLGFTGRISRGQYFGGLAVAMLTLLCATMFAAGAMNPTGGGAPILALPLLAIFLWMIVALMIQRLREVGRPPALAMLLILALVLLIYPGLDIVEVAWPLLLACFLLVLALPGSMSRRVATATPEG
jgi:uncharacterized membrane protein YhaH (DUF805 family)